MPASISRTLARWAAGLTYEQLPEPVADKIKACVLFHLVSASVGRDNVQARRVIDWARREAARSDGATILTDGARVTRDAATMANCEVLHASGMTDSFRMITHPGPALIAAGLTGAELAGRTGRELVVALAAGYELHCRLAEDFVPSVAAHGFRPAPIFATLGAAMTAGRLLNLDENGLVDAVAVAASSASGLNEPARTGGGEQAFHDANAARQGAFAAEMAALGPLHGSEHVIEGDAGFLASYAGSRDGRLSYTFTGPRRIELESLTDGLGREYRLRHVMFKLYHAAGFNQPVIELMTELVTAHRLRPADIAEVNVLVNYLETQYPSPAFPRPTSGPQAWHGSTRYYAAYVGWFGRYPAESEEPAATALRRFEADPAAVEFMSDRVRVHGVHDHPMFSPEISIRRTDGTAVTGRYPYARMEWGFDQVVTELAPRVGRLPGGAGRLADLAGLVAGLDQLDSTAPLVAALAPAQR